MGLDKKTIDKGWYHAVTSLFNVNLPAKRLEAVQMVMDKKLDVQDGFEGQEEQDAEEEEEEEEEESDHEEDEEMDELDLTQPVAEGTRKSTRTKQQSSKHGYQIDSTMIAMSCDSDQ